MPTIEKILTIVNCRSVLGDQEGILTDLVCRSVISDRYFNWVADMWIHTRGNDMSSNWATKTQHGSTHMADALCKWTVLLTKKNRTDQA